MFVPIAPSYISTRRLSSSRYRDCVLVLLIYAFIYSRFAAANRARAAKQEKPAHRRRASALAICLTWPQVALNRHGFSCALLHYSSGGTAFGQADCLSDFGLDVVGDVLVHRSARGA